MLTSINSVSSWQSLPSDKNYLVKWLLKKNGFLAVCGADLDSELTTTWNSLTQTLRQTSSWICPSTSFLFTVHQSSTVSWNQWKSSQTWIWTGQVFWSLLTLTCHQATNICSQLLWNGNWCPEMLKPLHSFSTSCGLLGRRSKGLASFGQNVSLNLNSRQIFCCCLFYDINLMVDTR